MGTEGSNPSVSATSFGPRSLGNTGIGGHKFLVGTPFAKNLRTNVEKSSCDVTGHRRQTRASGHR